jgi:hypothetical protein
MSDRHRRETDIQRELKRLAHEAGGILSASAVVEAARDEDSPLHDTFTWDDSEAASRWRLHQARTLIRASVSYEKVGGDATIVSRVFVSLTPDRAEDGGGYRLATTVLSDADQRRQLLADALRELKRIQEKFKHLTELAAVFAALDDVVREHEAEAETPTTTAADQASV